MRYRILLKDRVNPELLLAIKSKHHIDVEGIGELYDQLISDGGCDSDVVSRIYYLAYTLALSSIEIIIVKIN